MRGTSDEEAFRKRLRLFVEGFFDPRLKTTGFPAKRDGLWAFAVSYDCRVVFRFVTEAEAFFIDIDSHDEVY